MKRLFRLVVLLSLLLLSLWGLFFEYKFFSISQERIGKQRSINAFVDTIEAEYPELSVHQLTYDVLMFKFQNGFQINDMEDVILKYETYAQANENAGFVRRIVFLDESVQDILLPRSGECVIEFARGENNDRFDVINIYDVNPDTYAYYGDYTSYQNLSRPYGFNVFVNMHFDLDDNMEVINALWLSPDLNIANANLLSDSGIVISEERLDNDY